MRKRPIREAFRSRCVDCTYRKRASSALSKTFMARSSVMSVSVICLCRSLGGSAEIGGVTPRYALLVAGPGNEGSSIEGMESSQAIERRGESHRSDVRPASQTFGRSSTNPLLAILEPSAEIPRVASC